MKPLKAEIKFCNEKVDENRRLHDLYEKCLNQTKILKTKISRIQGKGNDGLVNNDLNLCRDELKSKNVLIADIQSNAGKLKGDKLKLKTMLRDTRNNNLIFKKTIQGNCQN